MLETILPTPVRLVVASEPMWEQRLIEQEESYILNAVAKRRREFRAGRNCAKEALRRLGYVGDFIIPVGEMRQPLWPQGIVGSISHTDNYCAAIVAYHSDFQSIGIDVEVSAPLKADLHNLVCTGRERDWLASQDDPGKLAKLIFCIKESIYKAYFPIYGVFFDFQDAETCINFTSGTFDAEVRSVETMPGFCCKGKYVMDSQLVYAFTGFCGRTDKFDKFGRKTKS